MGIIESEAKGGNPDTTFVVTAPATAATTSSGCCAAPGATPAVKRTRIIAVVIIVFHVISLPDIGFIFWAQWLGPLAGIIMASVLLCVYQKGCYTIAAVIFAVGGIFDIVAMMTWIQISQAVDEAGEDKGYRYYTSSDTTSYDDDDDENVDQWGVVAAGLAVAPAIGALVMFIGSASAINAVMTWDQIGTQADPNIIQATYPASGSIMTYGTIPVSEQPSGPPNSGRGERASRPYMI